MARLTIIGAGIAGLVSAALAHARGFHVTVVEAGPAAGGIWKSTKVMLGGNPFFLDAGLRLPVATGDARLDDIIFHRPDFRFEWTRFDDWPRESAITANAFNPESSCLDATVLGETLHSVITEMRSSVEPGGAAPANALDHSIYWYGPTLANGLIRDAVMGLFETELSDLDTNAVQWFVPRRVVLGDHMATAGFQADEALTARVAHARHIDLPKGMHRPFLRPRDGGISTWVTALQASLEEAGVTFIFNDGVRAVGFDSDDREIDTLMLKSGRSIASDQVICTVAPALFAQAARGVSGPPPQFRHLRISHMLVDHAPEHRASYSLNFNRNPQFFRAIFHDNLQEIGADSHIVSFEHLVDDTDTPDLAVQALAECIRCGALPSGTQMLDLHSDQYRNSIPVPTIRHAHATAELQRTILKPITNLQFVGRSAGGAPFLDQIIHEAEAATTAITRSHSHA